MMRKLSHILTDIWEDVNKSPRMYLVRFSYMVAFIVLATLVVAATDSLKELFLNILNLLFDINSDSIVFKFISILLLLVALFTFLIIITKFSARVLSVNISENHVNPETGMKGEKLHGLILFLSTPNVNTREGNISYANLVNKIRNCLPKDRRVLVRKIIFGEEGFGDWNWQPLFIAINACLREDGVIIILSSGGQRGSDGYFPEIKECIKALFPKVSIHNINGLNMFQLSEMKEAVRQAIDRLHSQGARNEDILIDVTGGTAVCSVAGLIHAFEGGRKALYSGEKEGNQPKPLMIRTRIDVSDFMNPV